MAGSDHIILYSTLIYILIFESHVHKISVVCGATSTRGKIAHSKRRHEEAEGEQKANRIAKERRTTPSTPPPDKKTRTISPLDHSLLPSTFNASPPTLSQQPTVHDPHCPNLILGPRSNWIAN